MGILDIFTFKKEAATVFTKENFAAILEKAKEEIIKQVKENIPGVEKKTIVDNAVIFKVKVFRDTCKNKLVLWVIDQLIKIIPTVTQLVYDYLKAKIENL